MNVKHYYLVKETKSNQIAYIDYNRIDGYDFKPKNSREYYGVSINKLVLIKPTFVEKILKRKIKIKLDLYLKYIISILGDDEDDGDSRKALDEIARFRSSINNNYSKYLDEKYIGLLNKKINLLDNEIKVKMQQHVLENAFEDLEVRKSR